MTRSLRGKLALTVGLVAAASVAVTALVSIGLVRAYARQAAIRQLEEQAAALSAFGPAPTRAVRRLLQASGNQVAFIDSSGAVAAQDRAASDAAAQIDPVEVARRGGISGILSTRSAGEVAYVAMPVGRGRALGAVVLVRPVVMTRQAWTPVLGRILAAGGVSVVAAIGASFLVARRLARPLNRVADATARIAEGDLSQRVPVEGEDETAELARRFNAMAERLEALRRREQAFLAGVSHELRTPLTSIRGYTEALAERVAGTARERTEALAVIGEETARLERLVEDVMDLARLGAGEFRLQPGPADLTGILNETVKAHGAQAAGAGVHLAGQVDPGLEAVTDGLRVKQVVDTGPGIKKEDLPRVFERSYLWNASRGMRKVGTGLGLAIVDELSRALGGRVEVESEEGAGATFRLLLPAGQADGSQAGAVQST